MRRSTTLLRALFATYLVVIVLCVAAVGTLAFTTARSFYRDQTDRDLQARASRRATDRPPTRRRGRRESKRR